MAENSDMPHYGQIKARLNLKTGESSSSAKSSLFNYSVARFLKTTSIFVGTLAMSLIAKKVAAADV
jgi:hypothetical protein